VLFKRHIAYYLPLSQLFLFKGLWLCVCFWFDLMGAQTHYLLNSKRTCKPFTQLMWCFHLPLCSQSSYEFDSRQHLWSSTLVTCGRFVVFSGYILYVVFTKILYCNYTNTHIIINLWKKIAQNHDSVSEWSNMSSGMKIQLSMLV
jgi:hypothetical protein